jgi:glycosyltransferase involved in cell wall biosynthesis
MKILVYFSGKLFDHRGTPIRTRNIIRQLSEGGLEVYFAGHDTPEHMPSDHMLSLASPLKRVFQLIRFVRKYHIDLVYIQTSAGLSYAPFLWLGTRAKVGVDFHNRIYQEAGLDRKYSRARIEFLEMIEHVLLRFVYFATSCSYTLYDYYRPFIPRHLVLPVGVDTTLFTPDVTPRPDIVNWKGNAVLIGYAGNSKWYQGVETVLDAFAQCSEKHPGVFKLILISSSSSEQLRAFMKERKLEECMMVLDKQPHEEVPKILAAADILTVIRPVDIVTTFSFPSKLPEYTALGKAVVVSDVSDIGRYIKNGICGIIVPAGGVAETAKAFETLSDESVRSRIAKEARRLAEREFELRTLGRRLADFLLSLK